MSNRHKSLFPGFSLKRAIGITSCKQKIATASGIPTTEEGRKRKLQKHLWLAAVFGVVIAASAKHPVPEADSEKASAQEIKLKGRRTRRRIIFVALLVCLIFYLAISVIPDFIYSLYN